jgi:hypothetical protein
MFTKRTFSSNYTNVNGKVSKGITQSYYNEKNGDVLTDHTIVVSDDGNDIVLVEKNHDKITKKVFEKNKSDQISSSECSFANDLLESKRNENSSKKSTGTTNSKSKSKKTMSSRKSGSRKSNRSSRRKGIHTKSRSTKPRSTKTRSTKSKNKIKKIEF